MCMALLVAPLVLIFGFVMAGPVEMRVAHCVHDWASYTVAPMVLFILYHLVPVWLGRTVLRPARGARVHG